MLLGKRTAVKQNRCTEVCVCVFCRQLIHWKHIGRNMTPAPHMVCSCDSHSNCGSGRLLCEAPLLQNKLIIILHTLLHPILGPATLPTRMTNTRKHVDWSGMEDWKHSSYIIMMVLNVHGQRSDEALVWGHVTSLFKQVQLIWTCLIYWWTDLESYWANLRFQYLAGFHENPSLSLC